MAAVDEIAPDIYRISAFAEAANLQFNHFLILDDEPLLYHTGLRGMFPAVKEAVARLIEPDRIRWIGASHFEADEWGALNQWLDVAPNAQPICGTLTARVNLNDFALRQPRALESGRGFLDGQIPLPVLPDTASAPWLGRGPVLRGEPAHIAVLGPVSSERRRRGADGSGHRRPYPAGSVGLSDRRA